MPLSFEGEKIDNALLSNPRRLLIHHERLQQRFQDLAEPWRKKPETVLNENVLYVSQREYAVVDPISKGDIAYIATDSATTCHIVILVHPGTKVIGLAHFDGATTSTKQGVHDMLKKMDSRVDATVSETRSSGDHAVDGMKYELYMFGGFLDRKGSSNELSYELLTELNLQPQQLDIKVLCISSLNSCYKEDTYFPIYYGAGVDCNSLEIFRVTCSDRGPAKHIKGCRNFVGPSKMVCAYDNVRQEMTVESFDYESIDRVELWLKQTDSFLLKHLSTSPEQEPPHFAASVRESLACMLNHPRPLNTLFKDNKTYRYKLSCGSWQEVG